LSGRGRRFARRDNAAAVGRARRFARRDNAAAVSRGVGRRAGNSRRGTAALSNRRLQSAVRKRGVAQPKPELKSRGDVVKVEPPVVNVNPL